MEQRAETVARHVAERLLRVPAHTCHEQCRANLKNTRDKRRLQTFCQCHSALITYLVFVEDQFGDGVVGLAVCVCV